MSDSLTISSSAAIRVSTAQQATSEVETAIKAATEQHSSDRRKAYGPVVTVALSHLSDAAKLADQARKLAADAQAQWQAAAAAIQHATMNRAHLVLHPSLLAGHHELASPDGSHVIPSAETMVERISHSRVF